MKSDSTNTLNSNGQAPDVEKTVLIAKIDQGVVPALDKIADANRVNTSQLMLGLFTDITNSVDFLTSTESSSSDKVEEKFARLIVERCPAATPGALQTVQRIWQRAAELKAQEGGSRC